MTPPLVDIQNEQGLPSPDDANLCRWVAATLRAAGHADSTELTLRIVDEAEMRQLNHQYRGRDSSTNVLAFPAQLPHELELPLLGDIVICAPVVEREAQRQGKPGQAHWAHMVVHGSLHLLGYDHVEAAAAEAMEQLETTILGSMQIAPPYEPAGLSRETSNP